MMTDAPPPTEPDHLERLRALEVFAGLIASAAGGPWLDAKLAEASALLPNATPESKRVLQPLIAILQAGRQQVTAAPPPPQPGSDAEEQSRRQLNDELLIESRSDERLKSYEQLIIGLGYGAFFAIWSAIGPKLPRSEALISGGLMGLSLVAYLSFHIWQMVYNQTWQIKINAVPGRTDLSFTGRLIEFRSLQSQRYINARTFLLVWRIMFPVQLIFGFLGAFSVIYSAFAAAITPK